MRLVSSVLSAQGGDHLSSLAAFGSDSGGRKIQRQKVNLLQQQQRRKWSDWSECSSSCVKTRHRLNCDDIVGQQAPNVSTPVLATTNRISTATTRSSNDAVNVPEKLVITTPSSSIKDEENLLLKADEDDYADEFDEEDETDPCANVDTARTFEEKPCSGGQCRVSLIQRSSAHHLQAPTVKGSLSEPSSVEGANVEEAPVVLKQADLRPTRQRADNALNPRLPVKPAPVQFDKFNPPPPTNATTTSFWQAAPGHNNASAATRSIWLPSQLSALGEPSLQASLIQWAILLGSLLVIVLLIMLIARKLFFSAFQPSYHWMLAKHTIKSSSKLNGALNADCCYVAGRPPQAPGSSLVVGAAAAAGAHHQAPAFGGAGHLGCSTAAVLLADGQPRSIPPHHMCYAWRRNAPAGCNSGHTTTTNNNNNKGCPNGQAGAFHCIVDAQGRHMLDTAQNTFNTSNTNAPFFAANQSCHSTSSSYTTMKTARRFYAAGGSYDDLCERSSVISSHNNMNNYNYDTLNSNHPKAEDCFVPTRDIVPGRGVSTKQQCHRRSSASNEEPGGQDVRFVEGRAHESAPVSDSLELSRPRMKLKHRSPNVPERFEAGSVDEAGRVYDLPPSEQRHQQSGSSSLSVASEPDSVEESSGSAHSGQSTTAPMLSQAASSSFEQAPDLPNTECSTTPLSAKQLQSTAHSQHTNSTPNSSTNSPAFHGGAHKFRHHQRKNSISRASELASNFNVQSQPSSPMLVNQCMNRDKNLLKRSGQSASTKVAAIAMRFQEAPQESSSLEASTVGLEQHYPMNGSQASRRSGGASEIGATSNFQMMSDVHRADTNDDRHFYEEIDGKT